jgi:hypothetical protein
MCRSDAAGRMTMCSKAFQGGFSRVKEGMKLPRRPLLLLVLLALSACADVNAPFVYFPGGQAALQKQKPPKTNLAMVCFNPGAASYEQVAELAVEECRLRGFEKAKLAGYDYWQCRVAVPHRAFFICSGGKADKPGMTPPTEFTENIQFTDPWTGSALPVNR